MTPKSKKRRAKPKRNTAKSAAQPKQPAKVPSKKAGAAPKLDLEKFKKLLQVIRVKIAGELQHLEGDTLNLNQREASGDLSGYSFHMADMATDNFDREFNLGLASNEQQLLNMIDVALRKIEHNEYGVCEDCSKAIPQKRLLAMPYAPKCIQCQEAEEKEKRRR